MIAPGDRQGEPKPMMHGREKPARRPGGLEPQAKSAVRRRQRGWSRLRLQSARAAG